jgi:TM2 domain-containing membrane protein YozV
MYKTSTHSVLIGYITWILGFMGAHRFYFGKPITGTIWFFTLGLLGIGWIIDYFLVLPWRVKRIRAFASALPIIPSRGYYSCSSVSSAYTVCTLENGSQACCIY